MATQAIFPTLAGEIPQLRASSAPSSSRGTQPLNIICEPRMAENIVSNTRHPQNAFQEGRASDFTDVASATIKPMAPTSAPALPAAPAPPVTLDPRVVVTPLDPTRLGHSSSCIRLPYGQLLTQMTLTQISSRRHRSNRFHSKPCANIFPGSQHGTKPKAGQDHYQTTT